jgi:hypothetical protein
MRLASVLGFPQIEVSMSCSRANFLLTCAIVIVALFLTACSSTNSEKGPQGTIAYYVDVESSEPGVRIEVNNDYIGRTPLKLKIFVDRDGTFHNFGMDDYVIEAFPEKTNQFKQLKVFRTGRWFQQEDRIPSRVYFDMNQRSGFSVDLAPR